MSLAPVVTFYSYKGGVGRSFTLANIAALLARWGFRVLCIDWDIEAPGLNHYFGPHIGEVRGGLLDILAEFDGSAQGSWRDHLIEIRIDDAEPIALLAAGRADDSYVKRVQHIDWEDLYARGFGNYLESLRAEAIETYDFVLIDGRTGITDFNGIVTAQLPDILVFLFTANEQSVNGCVDVARRAVVARNDLPLDRGRLLLLPVPARFEDRVELEIAQWWRNFFLEKVGPLYDPWAVKGLDPLALLERTTIPYVPYYSFGERLAVLDPPALSQPISEAIERIAALLVHKMGRTELLVENRDSFVAAARRAGEVAAHGVNDLFISYGTRDREQVLLLAAALAARGFSVAIDTQIPVDQNYTRWIDTALDRSKYLVVVVGEQPGRFQRDEIHRFLRQTAEEEGTDRSIIPVVVRDRASMNEMPTLVQHLPFLSLERSTVEEVAEKIALRIQGAPIDVESGWQLTDVIDEVSDTSKVLFLSRAAADAEVANEIGNLLEDAGYHVIAQQWDFQNANFITQMHDALEKSARVIALLSPAYLESAYCQAELFNTLAGDPLNKMKRLVALRVEECHPTGLLAGIAYWDLVPIRHDRRLLRDVIRQAVREGFALDQTPVAGQYWTPPRNILSPEIQPLPNFMDSEDALSALDMNLRDHGTVVIYGMGGGGKSAIAREYAWRNRERYSIVWWIDAHSESALIDGLLRLGARMLGGLDAIPDRREAAQQVLGAISDGFQGRGLLIFDGLEDQELFRQWRPRGGADFIVTTRQSTWSGNLGAIVVRSWSLRDAVRFLHDASGRADFSDEDFAIIAKTLGGLPLALEHAAAYLRNTRTATARSYVARIDQHLANPPRGVGNQSVFATFEAALARAELETPGAAAIAAFAAFLAPDGIPEELLRQEFDANSDELRPLVSSASVEPLDLQSALGDPVVLEEALGTLDRLSLIQYSTETRTFAVHRLVQSAAREMLADSAVKWARAAVASIASAFPEVQIETWQACERLLPHAHAALNYLPRDEQYAPSVYLAAQCAEYLSQRAQFREAEEYYRQAIDRAEVAFSPKHSVVAMLLTRLAALLSSTDHVDEAEALLRQALSIVNAVPAADPGNSAVVMRNLGRLLVERGDLSQAQALLESALSLTEELGDETFMATIFTDLAKLHLAAGRTDEAHALLRNAIESDEKALGSDDPRVATDLATLATALFEADQAEEAERLLRRAVSIAEVSIGPNHPRYAVLLTSLARVLSATGRADEGESLLRRVLAIDEAAYGPEHPEVAIDLRNLARVLRSAGRSADAEALLRRALEISRNVYGPDRTTTARNLLDLAWVLADTGRISEARSATSEAARIFEMNFGPEDDRVIGLREFAAGLGGEAGAQPESPP